MNLEGILAISGKPGLYKMIAQSRGGLIVESLLDGKRLPIAQAGNVSALKDIAIYTNSEEKPLSEVYQVLAEAENYQATLNPKEASAEEMRAKMESILPDYDQERVYASDLKKLFAWYNLLLEQGLISKEAAESVAESGEEEKASGED